MTRFYLKPCKLGEQISVFYTVNGSPFTFFSETPIAIELIGAGGADVDCWIDTSGSMDDVAPEIKQSIRSVIPRAKILEDDSENWLNWFAQSLQTATRNKAIFLFINENDSYSTEELINQLPDFADVWQNSQLAYGHMFVVTNDAGSFQLLQQAQEVFAQPELEQTSFSYSTINGNYGWQTKIALDRLLTTWGGRKMRIYTPPSFALQKALDLISSLHPGSDFLNNLLPDSFFGKKMLEVSSDTPIIVKVSCGEERCPPGYCEIQISDYPGYCCIKA